MYTTLLRFSAFTLSLDYKFKKCAQYWPSTLKEPMFFGHMEVTLMDQSIPLKDELIERTLQIKSKDFSSFIQKQFGLSLSF